MTVEAWYTLGVLILMFAGLFKEYVGPDFVVFGALVALWTGGVVDTTEALSGFSNSMVIAIALLFIVSAAMRETGALMLLTNRLLGGVSSEPGRALPRLLIPTAVFSSFMNNTPLVAMLTPVIRDWAVRNKRAPSKFLIPISYATILGGTCTLIGTSTNLTVSGLVQAAGHPPFGMFELSPVGVPATIAGLIFLTTFGHRLLPARKTPDDMRGEADREYSVVLVVTDAYPMVGKTVAEAGLRSLSGLYLAEIVRGPRRIVPVTPNTRIAKGDRLVLFGLVDTVVELRKTQGLVPLTDADDEPHGDPRPTTDAPERVVASDVDLFEVVISANSPLVGQTLRDAGFRRRYDAAVIAIHRNGQRMNQKLGDVVMRPGDTLMVEASAGFRRAWANSTHFYLVSQVEEAVRPRYALANFALLVLIAMVVLVTAKLLPIAKAAAVAAVLLVWFRCIRPEEARRSVDLSVLLIIASAFGISAAVTNSGLADVLAHGIVSMIGGKGPFFALALIYVATVFATEALSNAAAAALIVPIALSTAAQLGVDHRPFAIAVTLAASMSFITPVGYQCNLIVYGPGGYKFGDFARIGIPMSLLCFAVAMITIPIFWPLRAG
ncbi:MAG: SLC13 family permease [Myxococcales bacterium]|nr:SLC13 family permease [Myxococcales bacterium]MCB9531995.1 SLC13 family permease [Myxococcales bacterium]MCB9533859.1 SLC13 family permease [Myxococcales bacterium]